MILFAGFVLSCGCWTREHDQGGTECQYYAGDQLLGFSSEEELAERPCIIHQEHHVSKFPHLLEDENKVLKCNFCFLSFAHYNCSIAVATIFLAPVVTEGKIEGAMDSASVKLKLA